MPAASGTTFTEFCPMKNSLNFSQVSVVVQRLQLIP